MKLKEYINVEKVNWEEIKNFKKSEFITDPDKVKPITVYSMDALRTFIGFPCEIHVAYESEGHVSGSKHYLGLATDFDFKTIDPLNCYDKIVQFLKDNDLYYMSGLGFYPHWNSVGFHLDISYRKYFTTWGAKYEIDPKTKKQVQKYIKYTEAVDLYKEAKSKNKLIMNDDKSWKIVR